MDEDLKRLIEGSAAETRRQIGTLGDRIDKVDQRLEKVDQRLDKVDQRLEVVEQSAAETRRHMDVVAEGLRSDMKAIAQGTTANTARIERLSADLKVEFADVRSMIKFSHSELDRRIRNLEEGFADLQTRVERLESSTH